MAVAQGGLGACVFLGTSAIQLARPPKLESIDVTDRNYLNIRILLGTLFGSLIGLLFSSSSLDTLNSYIFEQHSSVPDTKVLLAFAPFIVGFSTDLVLTVFTRVVRAVQTFFGTSTSE